MNKSIIYIILCLFYLNLNAQTNTDTIVTVDGINITVDSIVVRSTPNYKKIVQTIVDDTSFYKAFKNLKLVNYTSNNDVQFYNGQGQAEASVINTVKQSRQNNCRNNTFIQEQFTGKPYNSKGEANYFTLQMFESLFFSRKQVCNETNIVGNLALNVKNKSGIEKHKEQLKMLFFNTGQDIPGIPFMAKKIALFKERNAKYYENELEIVDKNGVTCYLFTVKAKEDLSDDQKDDIVINEMKTWLDYDDFTINGRYYNLSYNAAIYDFDVTMKVDITKIGNLLYPTHLYYQGNFKVAFKDRERAQVQTYVTDIH
jgi:hypothetical protein